ncbi:MAG: hypothetical protein IME94_11015 [Proteobacteria bacterium]|nr:hypothetical protein [Pseudomonadota bacterium]
MIINHLFSTNFSTQEIALWIAIAILMIFLLIFTWKFVRKQIIKRKCLKQQEECQTSEADNSDVYDANSTIYKQSDVAEETDLVEEAKIFATYGKFDQAITMLQWQVKAFPDEIIPYVELFNIYIQLEDETAYIELLKSLALLFDENSIEFQESLANGLLNFPQSDELGVLSGQNCLQSISELPVEKLNPIVQTSKVDVDIDEAENVALKGQTEIVNNSVATTEKETEEVPLETKIKIDKSGSESLLLLSNKKHLIQNLTPLEQSIFFTFENKCQLAKNLRKQKQDYKYNKHKSMQKTTKNKIVLIKINEPDVENKNTITKNSDFSEQKIIDQFNDLLAIQKYDKGILLLETHLKRNPLLNTFYPLLMKIYIEFKMLEKYYSFRKFIFSHAIQPSIDIIMLISDAEKEIKAAQSKPLQVA